MPRSKSLKLLYSTSKIRGLIAKVPRKAMPAEGKLELPIAFSPKKDESVEDATVYLRTNCQAQRDLPIRVKFASTKKPSADTSRD